MLSFESDYIEGATEEILQRLVETNREPLSGYGTDPYCESAKRKIRQACQDETAGVYFLVGGTQTNAIVIDCMLSAYEGVVAATTGHVSVHEAGAIEFTGHKVLELPSYEGKIKAQDLETYMSDFYADGNHEHMVQPGMVYLSHPTEFGTLYTAEELKAISDLCSQYEIPLYLDGARLGYGLAAPGTDVDLPLIAKCCDAFYIGGTKVGALCGEAVVFTRDAEPRHFTTSVKQHGALLAKGRVLGVQFDTLFTDDLYLRISKYAITMASQLKAVLQKHQIPFLLDTVTNQQFVILENNLLAKLQQVVAVSFWEKADAEHTVVRLATSWSTKPEEIEQLDQILTKLLG